MRKNKFIYILLIIIMMISLTGCFSSGSLIIDTQSYEKKMFVGDKIYLTTNKDSISQNGEVIWESSDENVAVVSKSGLVEAVGEGVATITVTLNEYSNTVIIYVTDLEKKPTIDVTGPQQVIINEEITLSAISSINYSEFIWTSSDESIATVSSNGVIKGIKPGVVTIKVEFENDSSIFKEVIVLVRTGDGIQEVIKNIIEKYSYVTNGSYDLTSLNNKVVNTVKKVEKSVIGVANYSNNAGTDLAGTGTGGIYKKEKTNNGYLYTVFTNHHVIEDAKAIKVYLGDLDEYVNAKLIKSDEEMDIAIITFEHKNDYDVLKLGTIGSVNVGDFIIAIGNPGGFTFYGSVTFGMVSEETRKMKDSDVIYVQHDAPINPGNSGGPLFNLEGEVIGINTLKLAASDIEGMGFAIAMETFLEYLK